jgi:hypothetical protein
MKKSDTVQVVLSDMHSGSNYALFLGREWQGLKNNNHTPRSGQLIIRNQFIKYADEVKRARKNKKVVMIVNGDAIDGDHHCSNDVCTTSSKEQADIHIELMYEFEKLIDWQRGDEIYYTKGTEIHTGDWEDYIGQQMNAVPNGDLYAFDLLELNTNGVISWFVHHGPPTGEGANEGNTIRNWLKNIKINMQNDGDKIPDIIYTGHVHSPTYSSYIYRDGMKFKTIHGIILPSWQMKTRYSLMRAPVAKNKIGGVWQVISADGMIGTPRFCIMGYE